MLYTEQDHGRGTALQEQKLKELLAYLSANSPFYQELFKKRQIDISRINNLSDLTTIPTTSKDDLQQRTEDFVCVPPEKII